MAIHSSLDAVQSKCRSFFLSSTFNLGCGIAHLTNLGNVGQRFLELYYIQNEHYNCKIRNELAISIRHNSQDIAINKYGLNYLK